MRNGLTRTVSPSARTPEKGDSAGKKDFRPNGLTRQPSYSRKSPMKPDPYPSPSKPLRRSTLMWKVSSVFLLAVTALLLCLNSLSRQKHLLRRILLPDHPIRTSHMPHYRPLMRAFKIGEFAECPALPNVTYNSGKEIGRHYPLPRAYWREECQCTPVHNFVILSMQRSGSGWFETFLNSHPNISSHGEVFARHQRQTNASDVLGRLNTVYNLDWSSSAAKNSCTSAVGFKWMLNQGAMEFHPDVVQYFQARQVSVVMLLRRNVLRRLVSILANSHDRKIRGTEHISHTNDVMEAKKLAEFRPTLSTRHLKENLQRVQDTADEALQVFNSTRLMLVYYEDVVRNRSVLSDVQRFLGVPVLELNSSQVKIHSQPFNETVENYEQVRAHLNGSDFEPLLYDDYSHHSYNPQRHLNRTLAAAAGLQAGQEAAANTTAGAATGVTAAPAASPKAAIELESATAQVALRVDDRIPAAANGSEVSRSISDPVPVSVGIASTSMAAIAAVHPGSGGSKPLRAGATLSGSSGTDAAATVLQGKVDTDATSAGAGTGSELSGSGSIRSVTVPDMTRLQTVRSDDADGVSTAVGKEPSSSRSENGREATKYTAERGRGQNSGEESDRKEKRQEERRQEESGGKEEGESASGGGGLLGHVVVGRETGEADTSAREEGDERVELALPAESSSDSQRDEEEVKAGRENENMEERGSGTANRANDDERGRGEPQAGREERGGDEEDGRSSVRQQASGEEGTRPEEVSAEEDAGTESGAGSAGGEVSQHLMEGEAGSEGGSDEVDGGDVQGGVVTQRSGTSTSEETTSSRAGEKSSSGKSGSNSSSKSKTSKYKKESLVSKRLKQQASSHSTSGRSTTKSSSERRQRSSSVSSKKPSLNSKKRRTKTSAISSKESESRKLSKSIAGGARTKSRAETLSKSKKSKKSKGRKKGIEEKRR